MQALPLGTDALGLTVALALLLMSIASWALILWKAWALRRAQADLQQALPAFWDAASFGQAQQRVAHLDRERVLLPLLQALQHEFNAQAGARAEGLAQGMADSVAAQSPVEARLTRGLRGALGLVQSRLRYGQVILASIGSTAPFLGLLGTVWGIYQALLGIAATGSMALDKVSGPVGEALVMTALGLGVAIPAVLGYNLLGRRIEAIEAELEGFAHDLRAWRLAQPQAL
jgi:biopolymer transport protein ExbB